MSARARLACLVRGHTWEQHSDPAGTVTFCSRCGKLRHEPGPLGSDRQMPPDITPDGQGPPGGD